MNDFKWAEPKKPQPASAYVDRHVWDIVFSPMDNALLVVMFKGTILSDESFGGLYSDEGGILSVQNDEKKEFWRKVYSALVKQDAKISYHVAVPGGFFHRYKYKHEYLGNNKTKLLEIFPPGVHDDPADFILVSDDPAAHEEKAVRKATAFLEYILEHDYPYSYMVPLLEKYQQLLWISRSTLFLLTRNSYLSREEIKQRLSEAVQPFGLTLPKYDWIITRD